MSDHSKSEDIRATVDAITDQVRTSLLAVLGAGAMASKAVADAVSKTKDRVAEGSESARQSFDDLSIDPSSLREKLDPVELRRIIDEYAEAALKLYNKLAESGEQAWEKIAAQPQVKKSLEQLEDALRAVSERFGDFADDARERVDEVLSKVTKRSQDEGDNAATPPAPEEPAK